VDFRCGQSLSAGTASASSGSKNRFLQSLQTRAFPAGVDCPPLQSTIAIVVSSFRELFQRTISAEKKHGDSCGRKGLFETTQCVAQGRLNSRPRKAKCFFVAEDY